MVVGLHGPNLALEAGDEYLNCDPAEAKRLVEAGFAVPIVEMAVELAIPASPARETRTKAAKQSSSRSSKKDD